AEPPTTEIYTLSLHDALPILVGFSALDGTTDWYFDGWQLEAKPFATSFVAGTRAAGVLQYSASGIINPDAGTIAFWYRPEFDLRSEEHTSELQSRENLVCRLL